MPFWDSGGGEVALPLLRALVVLGDGAAVARDVGHGRVPVTARQVEGREALVLLAVLRRDLVECGEHLVLGLREGVAAGALLEHVLVVDGDTGAGVVRHAELLALEGAGVLQTLDPGIRVVVLLGVDLGQRAVEDVLHRLGVAELDDVRELVTTERGVELLGLVRPLLVLDVDLDLRVLLLELRVDVLDQFRPGALRVDHEPDRQALGTVLRVLRSVVATVPTTRRDSGHHRCDAYCRYELALHATPSSGIPATPRPPRRRTPSATCGAGTWSLMV